MNAAVICIGGLIIYFLGYRFYSKYLAEKIYKLDHSAPVPSHTMCDGVDYVPTNKYVLFGHHFASIAGAAPIVGPALAVGIVLMVIAIWWGAENPYPMNPGTY